MSDRDFTDDARIIDSYFYLPSRAGRAAMQEIHRRNTESIKIRWGVAPVDDYLIPMVPGDLVSILGRPGMAKTTAMIHLARTANRDLVAFGQDNRLVVYATWETLIEEYVTVNVSHLSGYSLEAVGRGTVHMGRLQSAIGRTVGERIALIGKSMSSPRGVHTLDDVDIIISWLADQGQPAAILLVDYLQRLPGSFGKDRAQVVSEHHERLKDMAISHRIPVVVAVQAKRDVDDYKGLKLPEMDDGQWTSVIEQTSDKVISLTRPIRYMDHGSTIEVGGETHTVDEHMLGMRVVKQRFGRAGRTFVINMDPPSCVLSERAPLEEVF